MGAFNGRNYNNPTMDKLLQEAAIEMDMQAPQAPRRCQRPV